MKGVFFMLAILASAHGPLLFAQETTDSGITELLQSYYQVKDALVAGSAANASAGANAFIKAVNGVSHQHVSEENINSLVKDAGIIANAKNIDKQRSAFANFSTNMAAVVKEIKRTTGPIYLQYCPMKKAYWLSSDKAIKNPYFGSAMLTCGNIAETLN